MLLVFTFYYPPVKAHQRWCQHPSNFWNVLFSGVGFHTLKCMLLFFYYCNLLPQTLYLENHSNGCLCWRVKSCFMCLSNQTRLNPKSPFSSIASVKSNFRKVLNCDSFLNSFFLLWTSSSLKHTQGIFNLFTFSVCWVLFVMYILNVYPSASIQLLKICLKFEHVQTCSCLSVPGSRLGPSGFFGGAGHLRFHRRCTF